MQARKIFPVFQTVDRGRGLLLALAILLPASCLADISLQDMLLNLQRSYTPIIRMITGFSFLMGIAFTVAAIYHLKVYGELRTMMASQTGLKEPLGYLLVAAVMLYLPTAVDTVMTTVFDYTEFKDLEYITADSGVYKQSLTAVLGLVQIIGLISFIRGWSMVKKSSEHGQRGGYGKGLTHIFGGILALNIVGTKDMIFSTFGFS